MRTILLFILFVFYFSYLNGQVWLNVGDPAFSSGSADDIDLTVKDGVPYVAFTDGSKSFKASVMPYDGSWSYEGVPGFTTGMATNNSIVIDEGFPYIAFKDANNGDAVSVMKFDGIDWSYIGAPGFSNGEVYNIKMSIENRILYVAFTDVANGWMPSIMKFDGTTWVYVGSPGFIDAGAFNFLVDESTIYFAFSDNTYDSKLSVIKFDGAAWSDIGNRGFSTDQPLDINIEIFNHQPYVAYLEGIYPNKPTVTTFDGTNWVTVGNPRFTENFSGEIDFTLYNGVPYVAFIESTSPSVSKTTVMKFDGTNWIYLGSRGFSDAAIDVKISSDDNGNLFVAYQHDFIAPNAARISVMRFCPSPQPPPPVSLTPNNPICFGEQTSLSALGNNELGWYDAPVGGNYLGSGSSYSTQILYDDTAFYVQDSSLCAYSSRTKISLEVVKPIHITGNRIICVGDSTELYVHNGDTYLWSNNETSSIIKVAPSTNTTYTVSGTSHGCTTTTQVNVVVNTCLNIEENELSELISIFPNPSNGIFNINLTSFESFHTITIMIIDLLGKNHLAISQANSNNEFLIDLSNLKRGIYLMQVYADKKKVSRKKIVLSD